METNTLVEVGNVMIEEVNEERESETNFLPALQNVGKTAAVPVFAQMQEEPDWTMNFKNELPTRSTPTAFATHRSSKAETALAQELMSRLESHADNAKAPEVLDKESRLAGLAEIDLARAYRHVPVQEKPRKSFWRRAIHGFHRRISFLLPSIWKKQKAPEKMEEDPMEAEEGVDEMN